MGRNNTSGHCKRCGVEFNRAAGKRGPLRLYCSTQCRWIGEPRQVGTCRQCKGPLPTTNRRRQFCSEPCRQEALKTERVCVRCGVTFRSVNAKFCTSACASRRAHDALPTHICEVCGKVFKRSVNGTMRCCSRECGFLLQKKERSASKDQRGLTAEPWRGRYIKVEFAKCEGCDLIICKRLNRKFCSDACCYASKLIPKAIHSLTCKECHSEFKSLSKRSSFCSKACVRADLKRRQKHKIKADGTVFNRVTFGEVYYASDGKCHICGLLAPRYLRGSGLFAEPTIDHVVPLSRGGSHRLENVKLAHRACNSSKSDSLQIEARLCRDAINSRLFTLVLAGDIEGCGG